MARPAHPTAASWPVVAAAVLVLTLAGCGSALRDAGTGRQDAVPAGTAAGAAVTRTPAAVPDAAGTPPDAAARAAGALPSTTMPPAGSVADAPPAADAGPPAGATVTGTAGPAAPESIAALSFQAAIGPIDAALANRMHAVYPATCPVSPADLRYLQLTYLGFDGRPHTGEMVVAARVAEDVVTVFGELYAQRFEIHQMRLAVDFGGSDDASMAADNTSSFDCRPITGGSGWSEHSFGDAIDVNPVENPYLSGSTVLPPAGRAFLDRPDAPGVIHPGGVAVRAFAAIGWTWGGTWTSPVDLQHFSLSGR